MTGRTLQHPENHNSGHSAGCGVAPGADACLPEVLQCSEFLWVCLPAFFVLLSVFGALQQLFCLCGEAPGC